MNPQVIYEDKDFLVVEKPAGMQVHAARITSARRKELNPIAAEPTLVDWLLEKYPEVKIVGDDPAQRPGIVHRLDKATSGLMIVARTQSAFEHFKKLFQAREIEKRYLAMVRGIPKAIHGVIDAPIGIRSGTLKRSTRSAKMAKPAVTEYQILKEMGDHALLEVFPKTGRTHQIRVHLASIGHPVLGDALYGGKKQLEWVKRLMLHASSIAFVAPSGKRMKFDSETPF